MAKNKQPKVNIVFVLDMTGSMMSVKQQAIDGYNEYVTGMQQEEPGAEIALTTFNSHEIKVYPATLVGKAMLLNNDNYAPTSNTPLYDAIGQTIHATEKRAKKGERVAFVILTDGQENASREYTKASIFAKLKEKEAAGWGIIYLGANQDAYVEAMGMGINPSNVIKYATRNTSQALGRAAVTGSLAHIRTGHTDNLMADVDKDALAGDPFRPKPPAKKPKGKRAKS